MTLRSKIAMVVAEFLGTGILATAVINVGRSQIGIGYFVAFSAAITLAVLAYLYNNNQTGYFNPAVTIGMWTLRRLQTVQALALLAAQMLGGLAAWRLAEYFMGQSLQNLAAKNFEWKVLVAEVVGTAVFTMGVASVLYQRFDAARTAVVAGASLFIGIVVASVASNSVLNPAVALANQSWDRAYIFGPILGAIVGMNLYALLFAPAASLVSAARQRVSVTKTASAKSAGTAKSAKKRAGSKARTASRRRRG